MSKLGLFLGLSLFLSGCFSSRQELPEIILSYDDPVVQLKISELTDSVEIIQLETNDSILLPANFQLCLGEKYIVMEYSGAIHQFSRDGKYIRKMFQEGRGPEEYLSSLSNYIDDRGGRYYLTDIQNRLFSYDLNEGKLLSRQKLLFPVSIHEVICDTFLCTPAFLWNKWTSPFTFCSMTSQGEIIDCLPDTIINGSMFSLSICDSPQGQYRIKGEHSDTVYTITDFQKIPSYRVRGKYLDYRIKPLILLKNESRDFYFFSTIPVQVKYDEQGKISSISILKSGDDYRVNKKSYRSEIVKQVYIDTLGITLPFSSIRFSKSWVYFTMSAIRFKEVLKRKAEKGQLPLQLERLYNVVKEDDNPLFFIGKNKRN